MSTFQHIFVAQTGSFQDAADWSGNSPPGATDDAIIEAGGGIATSSADATVNSISTGSDSELIVANNSTFTATDGTVLAASDNNNSGSGNFGSIIVDAGSSLTLGDTFDNAGSLTLGYADNGDSSTLKLNGTVTFSGYTDGGANFGQTDSAKVLLGISSNSGFTEGNITGAGLVNVDDAILGGGTIKVTTLDNQADASIQANQANGNDLAINAGTFTNEGTLEVGTNSKILLGAQGATDSMTNTGTIGLGASSASLGELDAHLAISGNYTINGGGTLVFKGAGAQIISDGIASDTFTNNSNIDAQQSGTIGDAGIYGAGVDDLFFDNFGAVYADGTKNSSATLTLNTGANVISDGGGTLEAENAGTLVVDSPVTTGELYLITPAPPGGTIEANTGSTVDINSSVTSGVTTSFPFFAVSGQVIAEAGGTVVIDSGGSVSVPIEIDAGGAVELESGGAITGTVQFVGAGGTLALTSIPGVNAAPQLDDFADGDAIELPGSSVTSANIGADSITITTNLGTATFSNIVFSGPAPGGYVVTQDQTTGLLKLTFEASPVITGASSLSASGDDIDAGKTVTFTLQISTPVTVVASGDLPSLLLNDGEIAVYSGPLNSATQSLTFSYTVKAGDNISDLQANSFNALPAGATIEDGAGASLDPSSFVPINADVTVDTTPPGAPTGLADSSISGGFVNGANDTSAQMLTGSADAGVTVTVYDNGIQLGTTTANGSGAWSYTLGVLANGARSLTATATDTAGNVSAASSALAFTVDTIAPPPTIASAAYVKKAWTLNGTATADAMVTVYDGSKTLGTATANATGAWKFQTKENDSAARDFTATAPDAHGNVSAASGALIEGTHKNDIFDFASGAELLSLAGLYGNGGTDTIDVTSAATLTDADFANVHKVHTLQLSGASSATLGAAASKAGIVVVKTGAGATGITDTLAKALTIAAAALGGPLTLAGLAKFKVTGLKQNLAAGAATGRLTVTATGKSPQTIVLGSHADALTATHGGDTITGSGGGDTFNVAGHKVADRFVYDATSDSLDKPGDFDVITGFADKGNGGKFNDVIDLSAIAGITKLQGALASPNAKVAAGSVAYSYDAALNATLVFANAGAASLPQTNHSLMEIELAGGDFKLAAGNFNLA